MMIMSEEEIANRLLAELLNLARHIANVSNEDTKIGSGIFILNIIDSVHNCIMKNIVEALNLLASTATRQVDTLVNQGFVERHVAKTDRRKVILTLTEKGKLANERLTNHLKKVINNSLKTYSKEDMLFAIEVFHAIVENSESNLPLK